MILGMSKPLFMAIASLFMAAAVAGALFLPGMLDGGNDSTGVQGAVIEQDVNTAQGGDPQGDPNPPGQTRRRRPPPVQNCYPPGPDGCGNGNNGTNPGNN